MNTAVVGARVGIGEFSTMTRLSRKALRHYHELGLLTPAAVDPTTSYRSYDVAQVALARSIRRFRELDVPLAELRAWVAASPPERDRILAAHLARLEDRLARTQDAVGALRTLLEPGPGVVLRDVPEQEVLTVSATVALADLLGWWEDAVAELGAAVPAPRDVLGASFSHALFADEVGEVSVWLPAPDDAVVRGRVARGVLPGGRFAVLVHDGPDAQVAESWAALGAHVARLGTGAAGPVRERYLAGVLGDPGPLVTELAWPVAG